MAGADDDKASARVRRAARWANLAGLALVAISVVPLAVSFVVVPDAQVPRAFAGDRAFGAGLIDGLAAMSRSDVVLARYHSSAAPWVYAALWAALALGALVLLVNVLKFGVDRDAVRPLDRGERPGRRAE